MKKTYILPDLVSITTPMHIGVLYEAVFSDVYKKYLTTKGENVDIQYGIDENISALSDIKTQNKDMKKLISENRLRISSFLQKVAPGNQVSVFTSDPNHISKVKALLDFLKQQQDVYAGTYSRDFSVEENKYVTYRNSDFLNKNIIKRSEPALFFRVKQYSDALADCLDRIKIFPETRKKEAYGLIKDGTIDFCITSENNLLGIEIDKYRLNSWFDSILSYFHNETSDSVLKKIHICGPNTVPHHLIHYPSMLMAAKQNLPDEMYFHGYFNTAFNKSFSDIVSDDSPDFLRMYLFHKKNPFKDSKFSEKEYEEFKRFLSEKIKKVATKIPNNILSRESVSEELTLFDTYMTSLRFDKALDDAFLTLDTLRRKIKSKTATTEELIKGGSVLKYKLEPFLTKDILTLVK